ncbi:alpha/beta fold hydrolase [Musicola keenii]|uniref:alpha/beta fold hydrolase n=1 Tax=Musicola keenii TaxID=2884250 RepID=UPI00177BEFF4|nr:alpha/beta hydrolase [Musicola keenii]
MGVEKNIINCHGWNVYVEKHNFHPANETIIMVNGALSTTTAFRGTVKSLSGKFNVILFDMPFIGESLSHNELTKIITKEDEVDILLDIIEQLQPSYIYSISWGGLATLLALARHPAHIKKAIVASFSPRINEKMRAYVEGARALMRQDRYGEAAEMLNLEVGKYLPPLIKHFNYQYLTSLHGEVLKQVRFHIEQVLPIQETDYVELFRKIEIETLFLNGEKDEYTTADDVKQIGSHIPKSQFQIVPNAGHFLDMENRKATAIVADTIISFLE